MKTYLYPLLAGLLSLAACTNDTLQEIAPVAPGENTSAANTGKGTFFVDYSVDGGASTRAGNLLKIQTLDYYVYYAEGGELVKHRRIRIDSKQSFPLTRENMTWEQRQALQDTLQYDVKYRTLFIANVNSTLFNYDTYGDTNPHPAVVTGDTLYQNARILLPNVPFHEDNYYCLWEDTLHQRSTDPLDGPMKRNDVLLQRIVTRTDIRRTAFEDEKAHLEEVIANTYYTETCQAEIKNNIDSWLNIFGDNLQTCASLRPAANLYDYRNNGVPQFIETLKSNSQLLYDYFKTIIIDELTDTVANSKLYKDRITKWNNTNNIQVYFESNSRMNALGFDHQTAEAFGDDNYARCFLNKNEDGTLKEEFSIFGFAGQKNTDNTLSSVKFYVGNDAQFTIEGATFCINQGINQANAITCIPIVQINSISDEKNEAVTYTPNISTIMSSVFQTIENQYPGIIEAINDRFWDDRLYADEYENYSFDRFRIDIVLPNLTSDNADNRIELIPAWTYEDKTTNNNP